MMVRKVKMGNFRGFRNKTFDFKDKSVVLLCAENGVGKTTIIDAIEWCLTGDIGRLKNAFETRSTNSAERKMNTDGILKNRNAESKETVRVDLWLFEGEKEIILCREQKKDELDPESSTVTINGDKEKAKNFIQEYIGDSFYNFHFCDVQKSYNVQSKKRKNLEDFFCEFITNYDEQKQIAENLDIFADDVDRNIEEKTNQKTSLQEVIESNEKQLAKAREDAKQVLYPETIFYPDEKTEITSLDRKKLTAQKEEIKNCGYQVVQKELSQLIRNEELKKQKSVIKEIIAYWETKGESIQRAVKAGLSKDTDIILTLETKLRKLNGLTLSKETIFQDGESVIDLGNDGFTQSDFDADKKAIKEKEKKVKDLSAEIELLSNNNKMLRLLSSLSANKQIVIDYRNTSFKSNGVVRCPICGSESFATVEEALIMREADNYIKQNGEAVMGKEADITSLQKEIDLLYQKIINRAKSVVEKEKKILETEISNLKILKDEIQPYFDDVRKIQKSNGNISIEEITTEKARELLNDVESALLEDSKEQEVRDAYQEILMVLGYEFENETMQQTYAKVNNLITRSYDVSNFTYDVFVSKINAIDSIFANQVLSDLNQKIEDDNKKNQDLDMQIKELQKLKDTASQRAQDIREVVEKLSLDEYKNVGPALNKFYNKLIRFKYNDGIKIVQKNDGISLFDDKDKNLVNVLSNGQISVFLLAHFFASINARNDREKMKVYFIDDLTACMDDVNMLTFMDMLKYQMSSKETMEQLFFITCDERISRLLKYKLSGRGIELCELLEADFA